MSLATLITYYRGLLAYQYRDKPKASATIGLMVKQALADDLASAVLSAFNLDTAVGAQLDIIGKYVGVPRNVAAAPLDNYFGFWDYEEPDPEEQNPNGFLDYLTPEVVEVGETETIPAGDTVMFYAPITVDGDLVVDGDLFEGPSEVGQALFYQYQFATQSSLDLPDDAYRVLLRLKIFLNKSDNTLAAIQDFLHEYFEGSITVVDNKDMSLTYYADTATVPLSADILENYLPRPMGVAITVVET